MNHRRVGSRVVAADKDGPERTTVVVEHIYREFNQVTDSLANRAVTERIPYVASLLW